MGAIDYFKEKISTGNIVTRVFIGEISKEDIIESFNYMFNNALLDSKSRALITVISDSNIQMDISELESMVDFMASKSMLSNIKIAVVSDNPDKIILPTLVHFKVGDKLRPFDSVAEAKDWIIDNKL